ALVQVARPLNLLLIHERHPNRWRVKRFGAAESRWRDSKDHISKFVHSNRTAHHTYVALEMALPKGITEHNVRGAVRTILICTVEETPQIRMNAQYIKIISACRVQPDRRWVAIRIQTSR